MAGALDEIAEADGVIEAARVLLAVLDGASPPVALRPAAVGAMAMMTLTAIRNHVRECGAAGEDEQDAWIRRWIQAWHEGATMFALGDVEGSGE